MNYRDTIKTIFRKKGTIILSENNELEPIFSILLSLPSEYKTAIDVGANIGSVTKNLWEMGFSVYAIEPHPDLASQLRIEFHQKKYSRKIKILEFAASDSLGEAELWVGLLSTLSTLEPYWTTEAFPEHFKEKKSILVKTKRISNIINEYSIKKIGFLKIDTEGHDTNVLSGTFNNTSVFPLVVMFEANQRFPQKALDSLAILYQNEYKVFDFYLKEGEKIFDSYRLNTPQLPTTWTSYPEKYFYANIVAYHSDYFAIRELPEMPSTKREIISK